MPKRELLWPRKSITIYVYAENTIFFLTLRQKTTISALHYLYLICLCTCATQILSSMVMIMICYLIYIIDMTTDGSGTG